jgi:2'-5' RNA ligase
MRLFTALDLPDGVRTRYATLQLPTALDARWTAPEQFHVTLRFIGETEAPQADNYETALDSIEAPVAECVPYGLDVLPSRRNPSVLIVGLERRASLLSVYRSVSDALEAKGLESDSRKYRPHVTLARLDDLSAETVHQFLSDHDASDLPSFTADTVHLYESTLTSEGAVHERRTSVPLGPSPD